MARAALIPPAAAAPVSAIAPRQPDSAGPAAAVPPSTTVIPPAGAAEPEGSVPDPSLEPESSSTPDPATEKEIADYEAAQDPRTPGSMAHLHSLHEFLSETADLSPIGVELREDRCKLADGEAAEGLAIIGVRRNSPAAKAGLKGYSGTAHEVLTGASIVAALVFPPAILATVLIDQTHVGESYDVIIGVDGKRVTNVLDFEDQMRDVKPGDTVYLSVVRNGSRMQVPVDVPTDAAW